MSGRTTALFLCGLLASFEAGRAFAAEAAGYVWDLSCDWRNDDGVALERGLALEAGARIHLAPGEPSGGAECFLTLFLFDGGQRTLRCGETDRQGCAGIELPAATGPAEPLLRRVLAAIQHLLLAGQGTEAVPIVGRGEEGEELVAPAGDRGVLTELLSRLPPGRYSVRFVPVSDRSLSSFEIKATKDGRGVADGSLDLAPGLYRAFLLDPADPAEQRELAWLLAVSGERFAARKELYDRISGLSSPMNDSRGRELRRLALLALAAE